MCAVFTKGPFLEEPENADLAIILKKTGCITSMNEKPECQTMLIVGNLGSLRKKK